MSKQAEFHFRLAADVSAIIDFAKIGKNLGNTINNN